MRHIKQATAEVYGITVADLTGPVRRRVFVYPRQLAMHICRSMTEESLHDIGRAFGGRDHTTVLHADRAAKQRMTQQDKQDMREIIKRSQHIVDREAGGVFRSVRHEPLLFKSRRTAQ